MGVMVKVAAGGSDHYVASTAYCVCTTAANVAAKIANVIGDQSDSASPISLYLIKGTTIHVKFANSNTASSPTLNVSGTGAKSIMRYGTTHAGTSVSSSWTAGAIVELTYDGTNWVMNSGWDNNDNTTYSSKAAASGGTDVSLVTTGEKYTWNNKTSNAGTVTKVTAGTGLNGGDITTTGTISLKASGVTAGSYGPSANVTGTDGTTMSVPYITVDTYGRITSISNKVYTSKDTDSVNTSGTTYCKMPDGTLIQWTYGTVTSGWNKAFSWAQSFVNTSYAVMVSFVYNSVNVLNTSSLTKTTSGLTIGFSRQATSDAPISFEVIAIGRWK